MTEPGVPHESRFHVLPDHPALPGHFPGAPIVPGVVLLDRVLAGAEKWLGCTLQPTGLPHVKFLAPLMPGEETKIRLELTGTDLKFIVSRGNEAIASGRFKLAMIIEARTGIRFGPP